MQMLLELSNFVKNINQNYDEQVIDLNCLGVTSKYQKVHQGSSLSTCFYHAIVDNHIIHKYKGTSGFARKLELHTNNGLVRCMSFNSS